MMQIDINVAIEVYERKINELMKENLTLQSILLQYERNDSRGPTPQDPTQMLINDRGITPTE